MDITNGGGAECPIVVCDSQWAEDAHPREEIFCKQITDSTALRTQITDDKAGYRTD